MLLGAFSEDSAAQPSYSAGRPSSLVSSFISSIPKSRNFLKLTTSTHPPRSLRFSFKVIYRRFNPPQRLLSYHPTGLTSIQHHFDLITHSTSTQSQHFDRFNPSSPVAKGTAIRWIPLSCQYACYIVNISTFFSD